MPKRKTESSQSSGHQEQATDDDNNKMKVAVNMQPDLPQPPTKRLRVPLNFSIESIMQPASQQQQQHQVPNNHSHYFSNNPAQPLLTVSRSPSPATSDVSTSSNGSSGRASTGTLGSNRSENLSNQFSSTTTTKHHNLNNTESLASSRSSSRVSTPISPGCNSTGDQQQQQLGASGANNNINGICHNLTQPSRHHQVDMPAPHLNGHNSPQTNNGNHQHHHNQQQQAGTSKPSSSSKGRSGQSSNSRIRQVCTDSRLAPFECHLDNLDLWHRFHPLDTEMIITKQGRDKYQVLMDILPYDNKRYRYAYHKSSWQQAGKADPPSPTKLFLHPDGPFTLDQLKRQVISFEKIKLTNNDANKHGYIVLNSMHKYQPRIHLILWRGKDSPNLANEPVHLLEQEAHKTFIFSETIFTAVTAYQNHSITKLKIDSNPFAKGFRDSTRLTDLELESMQDLISDGQCPFSPPRAPPSGFAYFQFAPQQFNPYQAPFAGHPQLGGGGGAGGQMPLKQPGEDATAALLRERTIMALDSFLQQQQQQHRPSESPHQQRAPSNSNKQQPPQPTSTANHQEQSPLPRPNSDGPPPSPPTSNNSGGHPMPPPPYSAGAFLNPSGPPQPQAAQAKLEQFIMQQQQQFAAAMAAAAAGVHHAYPHSFQSLFAQVAAQQQLQLQQQQPPQLGSTTPTSQGGGTKAANSTSPPPRTLAPSVITSQHQQHSLQLDQTSPIGAAKSAARMLDLNSSLAGPLGGVPSVPNVGPQQIPLTTGPGGQQQQQQFHPQQLQAIMQHHHQQMAALAQQQHHNHHNNHHQRHQPQTCLQVEPLIAQDHTTTAPRTTKTRNK